MPTIELHDTNWWLDRVKTKIGCRSDAELAACLLTTKQAVSMQRHGIHAMQIKTCVRLAELMDVEPMLVICGVIHAQANEEDKKFWSEVFDRYCKRAAIPA